MYPAQIRVIRRKARNLVPSWNQLETFGVTFLLVITVFYILRVSGIQWAHQDEPELISEDAKRGNYELTEDKGNLLARNPKPNSISGKDATVAISKTAVAPMPITKGNLAATNIFDLSVT